MSLTALAVRLATIRALQGRTLAGVNVFDSRINPVNLVAKDQLTPVIIVTTDGDDMKVTGRDVAGADHTLELVIEVAVTGKVRIEVQDGEDVEEHAIPATDAGLEATLSIVGYQIAKALSADGGAWGDLWRRLVTQVHTIQSHRGADDQDGVRYAARQYVYRIDHISDPTPGELPGTGFVWHDVLKAMSADPELGALAKIVAGEIEGGDYLPWEIARGQLGLANDEAALIGSKPIKISEIVPLAEIAVSDGFTVSAQSAADGDSPDE